MSKAAGQPSTNTFRGIVDLLVDQRIRIDAWEDVLKETNPVLHERYVGMIENLRVQKKVELKTVLTARLKSKEGER
jgi:hypothetical protein